MIIGVSGGIGTALLQLGQLAEVKMYGLASEGKHGILAEYGATPIDYWIRDFVEFIRQRELKGIDAVSDGMTRLDYIRSGLSLLRCGGRWVSYGEPAGFSTLFRVLVILLVVNLLPNGKSFKLYGTSFYFASDKRPFLEDWATLFNLLWEGKIKPVIAKRFSFLETA
ncbi:MAG: zinc-binding dehydrogenase [Candidatus Caldatribacteriaceae bacterium]